MTRTSGTIRSPESCNARVWPLRTQSVSHIGNAHVLDAADDFNPDDLDLVRRQFPDRHVTLDGDVITVWPIALPSQCDRSRPKHD